MAKIAMGSSSSKKISGGKTGAVKEKPGKPVKKSTPSKTYFEGPSKKKTPAGLWLVPLFAILLVIWVLILKLDVYPPLFFKSDNQQPLAIAAIFQVLFLLLLGLVYSSRSKIEDETIDELKKTYVTPEEKIGKTTKGDEVDGEELLEVEPEVVEEEETEAPPIRKAPETLVDSEHGIVEYPPQITGGIYSDTLIPVGGHKILKLRTIIARSCLICDKQVECWPKVRRVISKEDFKTNIECKGGLRRLGVKDI
jgi:hypothetical protein